MPIVIENLIHTYSAGSPFQSTAVHGVSMTVEDGDFLGLMGHTGSGKTTLALHLNALLLPTGGKVLVDGLDTADKNTDKREIRRRVGLVFQYPEYQLFEETVEKDVAFGPKNLGISEAECLERAREGLLKVGLNIDDIGQRSPFELSGGQMRRVAIAGVLAMRPKVLVLDEPTAGLDPAGRKEILAMVKSLHQDGTTVVMVSHSMEDMAQLATRVAVMNHGKLAMLGTPAEVFAHGRELTQMGLNVPAAVLLADALREKGFAPPEGICRMEQMEQWILQKLGEKGAKA